MKNGIGREENGQQRVCGNTVSTASKSLTGDNLPISRGMSEIASFYDIYFLATQAKI